MRSLRAVAWLFGFCLRLVVDGLPSGIGLCRRFEKLDAFLESFDLSPTCLICRRSDRHEHPFRRAFFAPAEIGHSHVCERAVFAIPKNTVADHLAIDDVACTQSPDQ